MMPTKKMVLAIKCIRRLPHTLPYTLERVQLESLEWAEYISHGDFVEHHAKGGPPKGCEFRGQIYPSIADAVRSVGHSKSWMMKRGLIIFKDEETKCP